jgi:hypothetical protein
MRRKVTPLLNGDLSTEVRQKSIPIGKILLRIRRLSGAAAELQPLGRTYRAPPIAEISTSTAAKSKNLSAAQNYC